MKKHILSFIMIALVFVLSASPFKGHHNWGGSPALREQIELRLDKIESEFWGKLDRKAQARLDTILGEIRGLLKTMPEERPVYWKREISSSDLLDLKEAMRRAVFGSDQVSLLRTASRGYYYTCAQIIEILGVLVFSEDKLEALRCTYPRCIDPGNGYKIVESLVFDKDKAWDIIENTVFE